MISQPGRTPDFLGHITACRHRPSATHNLHSTPTNRSWPRGHPRIPELAVEHCPHIGPVPTCEAEPLEDAPHHGTREADVSDLHPLPPPGPRPILQRTDLRIHQCQQGCYRREVSETHSTAGR